MGYAAENRKRAVWNKARPVLCRPCDPWWDAQEWRLDDWGNLIRFRDYGNRNSLFGWEIDHVVPQALDGPSTFWNERPLHWLVNARRGADLAAVVAEGRRSRAISQLARVIAESQQQLPQWSAMSGLAHPRPSWLR